MPDAFDNNAGRALHPLPLSSHSAILAGQGFIVRAERFNLGGYVEVGLLKIEGKPRARVSSGMRNESAVSRLHDHSPKFWMINQRLMHTKPHHNFEFCHNFSNPYVHFNADPYSFEPLSEFFPLLALGAAVQDIAL